MGSPRFQPVLLTVGYLQDNRCQLDACNYHISLLVSFRLQNNSCVTDFK